MVHYQVGRKDFSLFNEIREMEQFSSVTQTRQEQPNGWVVLVIHGHLIDLLLKAFLGIVSWQVNWHLSGNWGSLWGTCIPSIKHLLSFENNGPSNLRARHLEKQNSCKSPMRTRLKFLCVKCCFFSVSIELTRCKSCIRNLFIWRHHIHNLAGCWNWKLLKGCYFSKMKTMRFGFNSVKGMIWVSKLFD